MLCSGCGKTIPFGGAVCPFCQRDKSGDQQQQVVMMIFGLVGGALGYFISGVGAAIIAMVVGMILGMALVGKPKTKPPEVHVAERASAKPSLPTGAAKTALAAGPVTQVASAARDKPDAAVRLASLVELKEKGFITEAEFALKRQEILANL